MLQRISPIHKDAAAPPEQQELMRALQEAHQALRSAHLTFDEAVDPDLVESCIFEIRALQARINYLLRRMKAAEEQAAAQSRECAQRRAAAASRGGGRRRWV